MRPPELPRMNPARLALLAALFALLVPLTAEAAPAPAMGAKRTYPPLEPS